MDFSLAGRAGGGGPLSDDDLSLLVRWVDPTYLSEAAWPRVRAKFAEDGSVQLKGFLKKGLAQKVGGWSSGLGGCGRLMCDPQEGAGAKGGRAGGARGSGWVDSLIH